MRGVYGVPLGADFGQAFVDGLIARYQDRPPQDLAQVTVYLNSARTLTAVRAAFDQRGARLLPQLRLIAQLGGRALQPALGRMLDLAALIEAALAHQPDLLASQSVPALAKSLAALMAEMQLEGLDASAFDLIEVGEHAGHWQRALQFVRIAADAYLSGPVVDREALERAKAQMLAQSWAEGIDLPKAPVIVAGSTGSHGATRMFMSAVARLPQGAVVLPGFDFDQPEDVWVQMGEEPGEEHPQARFVPFIQEFGLPQKWRDGPKDTARNRLTSLAMRPAPVTDQWVYEGPLLGDMLPATASLSLIEADQPQAEAEAIALVMRGAVEDDRTVTLIAADRGLTRRVTAALDRWGIVPDDSAGQPLELTPLGLFLRAIASLSVRPLTIDGLLILLKNQITANPETGDHLLNTRELELHLRRHGPAFPDPEFLESWGAQKKASSPKRPEWAAWLAQILRRISPLSTETEALPITDRIEVLASLAQMLAAGPSGKADAVWVGDTGRLAKSAIEALQGAAEGRHRLNSRDFAALVTQQLASQALRRSGEVHPLVKIRGPREARTDATGLVILAGLNEGGWPQPLDPDPWLSRQMRRQAGLTSPERLIGLFAHDFQQGLLAQEVILTRAGRNADAETVPSRWLNRLTNLLEGLGGQNGPQALAQMRERGRYWLDLVQVIGVPSKEVRRLNPPAARPSPRPPKGALQQISVTQVRTLIRDPYAIYASKVLGLSVLNPLRMEPDDPRQLGNLLHAIAEKITRTIASIGPDAQALERNILSIAFEEIEASVPWPAEKAFLRARIRAVAGRLAKDDAQRLHGQKPVIIEETAGIGLRQSEVRLIARPDRLDLGNDGSVWIYDYKSGQLPTQKQMEAFDKQLSLTAGMVSGGAFPALGRAPVAGVAYIRLGGSGETEDRLVPPDLASEELRRLDAMLAEYQMGKRGFTALNAIEEVRLTGDYAHLARYGEWSLADAAQSEDVGT